MVKTPLIVRIMRRIRISTADGCWVWPGAKTPKGYGLVASGLQVGSTPHNVYVHRAVYEHYVGPVPEGHWVSPSCRNPSCCNPRHLDAVSPRDGVLRGDGPRLSAARQTAKTHCPRGHPYSGENLYVWPRGGRGCRACDTERHRLRRAKKRAAKADG